MMIGGTRCQQVVMSPAKEHVQSPAPSLRIAHLVLCTIGACMSADLLRLHVRVHTDPNYHAYCAISEQVDCASVAQSSHAVFAGLPVALWGLLGYLFMAVLVVWGLRRRLPTRSWPFGLLYWLALLSSLMSVGLFGLSVFVIKSTCIVCCGTYLVNLLLLLVARLELRRRESSPPAALAQELRALRDRPHGLVAVRLVFVCTAGILWLSLPRYWVLEFATGPGGLTVGETKQGHPWIGAKRPLLTIVEYSDYQCPFCQRGHAAVRSLVEANPDKISLEHRHYPLDQLCNSLVTRPFHPHACRYAYLAHCAGRQGRFWEANDYLFEHGRRPDPVGPEELAGAVGLVAEDLRACLSQEETRRAVEVDLESGRNHGIRGTPTFVINGRMYPGRIPQQVIDRALGGSESGQEPDSDNRNSGSQHD
jgi:protein-disulfide isomerase/uncharacterized membrane protein